MTSSTDFVPEENAPELVLEYQSREWVPIDSVEEFIVERALLGRDYIIASGQVWDTTRSYEYLHLYIHEDHVSSCVWCTDSWPEFLMTRVDDGDICTSCDENHAVSCEGYRCHSRIHVEDSWCRNDSYYCSSCDPGEDEYDEDDDDSDYYDGDRRSGRGQILPNGRQLIEPYCHTDEYDPLFNFTEYRELPDVSDLVNGIFTVSSIKSFQLIKHRSVPDKFPALGFELELKIRDTSKRNEAARFILEDVRPDYLLLKEDATVNGWEQVTYAADYRAHMELYPWEKLPILGSQYGMYAWNDRDRMCGLHVHISRSAFKPSHLHRFVTFHDNHVDQLVKFSGRHNRMYAAHGRDFYDNRKEQALGRQSGNRSVAVNLTSRKTVELRYFRGSLKPQTVKAVVQFTHALWLFTRDMTSNDVRHGSNTFDNFARFADEHINEYPDLYPRLVERGVS